MTDFERIHEGFTTDAEGGYVWNPKDPGGETNLGVTRRVWLAWCAQRGLTPKPMRSLTHADVLPLYEANYWQPLAAKYPWPLSAALYDASVNSGPGDGNPFDEMGQESGATWMLYRAYQLCPKGTPLQLAQAVCDARAEYYATIIRRNKDLETFRVGWNKRLSRLRAWLNANAEPTRLPNVLLVPLNGGEPVPWNGQPAPYGGVPLTAALIEQFRTVYPLPGGPWTYQGIKLWRRQNGDLVLERL
ncbi:glycosyl hydrolase 108 family protein [uncultured Deinococcus sp.]|uniref:glycosyl hydrolase 108 family protein n=1 Tax=uncultured Deinococcus sp. TaxID=158789 RepID=UPI00258CC917|nr:glycosyl hydrolase 108 family protein [uncultured Deinococcus sp.]